MTLFSGTSSADGSLARATQKRRRQRPRFAAFLALSVSGLLGSLIFLASQTQVPQIIRAPGMIKPVGDYRQIETMEGGIVQAVHVRDGQAVSAGDPLIDLHHPDLIHEKEVLSGQLAAVEGELTNIRTVLAMLEEPTGLSPQVIREVRAQGLSNAAARLDLYAQRQRLQTASINEQTETLGILSAAVDFAQDRVAKKEEVLKRYAQLRAQGLKSLSDYLEEEDEVDAVKAAAADAKVRLAEARNALTLTRSALTEETLSLRDEMLSRMSTLEREQAQTQTSLRIVSTKLDDLRIVAPAGGIVQSGVYPTAGEVIAPGETVFELLPTRQKLIVEARIPNAEIGHVSVDHPVLVSVDTYDIRRYGKAHAHLTSIYPVPLTDEQTGETYFRALFTLSDNTVGSGPYQRHLQAGMTVVAEVTANEQTLLSYLLKPVQFTLERAFNER